MLKEIFFLHILGAKSFFLQLLESCLFWKNRKSGITLIILPFFLSLTFEFAEKWKQITFKCNSKYFIQTLFTNENCGKSFLLSMNYFALYEIIFPGCNSNDLQPMMDHFFGNAFHHSSFLEWKNNRNWSLLKELIFN